MLEFRYLFGPQFRAFTEKDIRVSILLIDAVAVKVIMVYPA